MSRPLTPDEAVDLFYRKQPAFFYHISPNRIGVRVLDPLTEFEVPLRRSVRWVSPNLTQIRNSVPGLAPEERLAVQTRAQEGREEAARNLIHNFMHSFRLGETLEGVARDYVVMATNWALFVPYEAVLDSWTPAASTGELSHLDFPAFLARNTISDAKVAARFSSDSAFHGWVEREFPTASRLYSIAFQQVVSDHLRFGLEVNERKQRWHRFRDALAALSRGHNSSSSSVPTWPTVLWPALERLRRVGVAKPPALWGCCDASTPNTIDMMNQARHAWEV
ncbi:hypothetical protein JCM10207_005191 [Rhodosporidiobolus poonsookiae]